MGDSDSGSAADFQQLIRAARAGDPSALSQVFEACQEYLLFVANHQLDRDLHAKFGASDIVQETMLVAHNKFAQFEGGTREELISWLRGILINDMRTARRFYKGVQKRQLDREGAQQPDQHFPQVAESCYTPGTQASIKEEAQRLTTAIAELPTEYRQVIRWRNWEQLQFTEIARLLDKSPDAARKIWARAIQELEKKLAASQPYPD